MAETFEELVLEFDEMKKAFMAQIREVGQPLIVKMMQPLFDLGVESVSWQQYTPYFNDGDPCQFRVYAYDLLYGWPDGPSVPYPGYEQPGDIWTLRYNIEDNQSVYLAWSVDSGWTVDKLELLRAAEKDVAKHLEYSPDVMLNLFGDHATVTVNRDGSVEVDEYSHD